MLQLTVTTDMNDVSLETRKAVEADMEKLCKIIKCDRKSDEFYKHSCRAQVNLEREYIFNTVLHEMMECRQMGKSREALRSSGGISSKGYLRHIVQPRSFPISRQARVSCDIKLKTVIWKPEVIAFIGAPIDLWKICHLCKDLMPTDPTMVSHYMKTIAMNSFWWHARSFLFGDGTKKIIERKRNKKNMLKASPSNLMEELCSVNAMICGSHALAVALGPHSFVPGDIDFYVKVQDVTKLIHMVKKITKICAKYGYMIISDYEEEYDMLTANKAAISAPYILAMRTFGRVLYNPKDIVEVDNWTNQPLGIRQNACTNYRKLQIIFSAYNIYDCIGLFDLDILNVMWSVSIFSKYENQFGNVELDLMDYSFKERRTCERKKIIAKSYKVVPQWCMLSAYNISHKVARFQFESMNVHLHRKDFLSRSRADRAFSRIKKYEERGFTIINKIEVEQYFSQFPSNNDWITHSIKGYPKLIRSVCKKIWPNVNIDDNP